MHIISQRDYFHLVANLATTTQQKLTKPRKTSQMSVFTHRGEDTKWLGNLRARLESNKSIEMLFISSSFGCDLQKFDGIEREKKLRADGGSLMAGAFGALSSHLLLHNYADFK